MFTKIFFHKYINTYIDIFVTFIFLDSFFIQKFEFTLVLKVGSLVVACHMGAFLQGAFPVVAFLQGAFRIPEVAFPVVAYPSCSQVVEPYLGGIDLACILEGCNQVVVACLAAQSQHREASLEASKHSGDVGQPNDSPPPKHWWRNVLSLTKTHLSDNMS